MQLTQRTDYSLRVLMYCAACQTREAPVTITELAQHYGISRSHLTKVVQHLGALDLLDTTRGRGGGLRLHRDSKTVNLGRVVRWTEPDFALVECFTTDKNACVISAQCKLKHVLADAMAGFLAVLDEVTLADLIASAPVGLANMTAEAFLQRLGLPRPRAKAMAA
jgi:Rrf2 family transcriptional regulator, nitric oxide-sensitive transcriptional repressor